MAGNDKHYKQLPEIKNPKKRTIHDKCKSPAREFQGRGGVLIFVVDKCKGFINGVQGQIQVFLGVTIADISMVKGSEKESFTDHLGIKIFSLTLVCTGIILFKRNIKHGAHTGEFRAHIMGVNQGLDFFHELIAFFPDIFKHLVTLKDFNGFQRGSAGKRLDPPLLHGSQG